MGSVRGLATQISLTWSENTSLRRYTLTPTQVTHLPHNLPMLLSCMQIMSKCSILHAPSFVRHQTHPQPWGCTMKPSEQPLPGTEARSLVNFSSSTQSFSRSTKRWERSLFCWKTSSTLEACVINAFSISLRSLRSRVT